MFFLLGVRACQNFPFLPEIRCSYIQWIPVDIGRIETGNTIYRSFGPTPFQTQRGTRAYYKHMFVFYSPSRKQEIVLSPLERRMTQLNRNIESTVRLYIWIIWACFFKSIISYQYFGFGRTRIRMYPYSKTPIRVHKIKFLTVQNFAENNYNTGKKCYISKKKKGVFSQRSDTYPYFFMVSSGYVYW